MLKNGIVFNPQKFVFCQEEVDFLGFTVTLDSLKPAAHMLRSIQEFPTPSDIRGIRSFFGFVNQVGFAFSMTETMAPFHLQPCLSHPPLSTGMMLYKSCSTMQRLKSSSKYRMVSECLTKQSNLSCHRLVQNRHWLFLVTKALPAL